MLTRRAAVTLVALAPAALLTACSNADDPPPAPTTPDTPLPSEVAAQELTLVALYEAIEAAFPELAGPLDAIRSQHIAHATALDAGAQPAPPPSAADMPDTRAEAIQILIAAERRASRDRTDSCVAADDAAVARTLAFIAASEASHLPALRALR